MSRTCWKSLRGKSLRLSALLILLCLVLAGCVVFTPEYFKGSDYDRARMLYESGYLFESRAMAEKIDRSSPSYEASRKLLKDIKQVFLDISREHMEMGENYEKAGIIPSAVSEYRKSLKYNPENLLVRKKLAMVAEKNLTRVRQLLPATRAKAADGPKHWHEIDDEKEWDKMKGDKNKG